MSSFREVRDVCLVLLEEGFLTEKELILLHLAYDSRNPEFPYSNNSPFCIEEMNEAECLAKTRPNFSSESPANPQYNQVPTKNNLFWTERTVPAIESA